ncbi:hypothetical protein C7V50_13325 [Klebsiella pneumoniae]|nr:hypothetical protein [Escherichia coli]EFP6927164.1 DinI-like family protein [Shigella dysenteriae]EJF5753722.1 DinI-like family protein [Shigella sonnei]RCG40368.1 hypothetical protein C7V46_10585 [Klebsiella pneumoniae]EFO4701269.1 hypothetical protein [Escherichia coli]
MTRRLSSSYEGVEVILKTASIGSLSVLHSTDKEGDKEYAQEVWESAGD